MIGTGGVDYELPCPALESHSGQHYLYHRTNRWTLQVDENHHVILNGVGYGTVAYRDKLVMNWDGTMIVNGVQRYPDEGREP